eukprot:CAMPEP_0118863184 /NCGR_PEP_ID=MMETSP1163-20130328/8147_1 /TAXON_ID=124430 /ORGANISM="Phaeomonas parva, Strain CCMP2877" /LENGTH=212 /DNA_ID=CAMNT_0006797167 /DNA_START=67 /DNA_END=701 /DNA_ORIENTATION=-
MAKPGLKRAHSESSVRSGGASPAPRSVRPKVAMPEDMPEDEEGQAAIALGHQNVRLGREMRGYRRRVKRLEAKVRAQEAHAMACEAAAACLHQHWAVLESSLKSVLGDAGSSEAEGVAPLLEQLLGAAKVDPGAALPRPTVNLLDVYEKQASAQEGDADDGAAAALERENQLWLDGLDGKGEKKEADDDDGEDDAGAPPFRKALLARTKGTA